jgi:hypothetical protein
VSFLLVEMDEKERNTGRYYSMLTFLIKRGVHFGGTWPPAIKVVWFGYIFLLSVMAPFPFLV